MIIIHDHEVARDEPPPHGAIGRSTAYRISDAVPAPRALEFRKRVLHPGAAIGAHRIDHDEVYYVLEGEGRVEADGRVCALSAGTAAYLYRGSTVGIAQVGEAPLTIIVAYPNG
jgi:mannose-6-phosphate isomerase-like protein (cupin superfamily)